MAPRVTNTVHGVYVSEGTWLLRDLVTELGIGPAACLLGASRDQVAIWTREGLPNRLKSAVRKICREHLGFADTISQDSAYNELTSFPVALERG